MLENTLDILGKTDKVFSTPNLNIGACVELVSEPVPE